MQTHAKQTVKHLVGQSLIRTGLWERLLRTWARRKEVIILAYHRVISAWDRTLDYSQPGMVITAETFEYHMRFLKEHFDVVPLSLFAELPAAPPGQRPFRASGCSQRPAFRRPLCAITFDDGWRDNYEIAFPILRRYDLPATIFLTTDFIGTDRVFWHTELLYLLLHEGLSGSRQDFPGFRTYPAPVRQGLRRLARMRVPRQAQDADSLVEAVKETCDEDRIEGLIRDLAESIGLSRPLFPGRRFFLDWNQVREMAAAGIEIGSHSCSHRILTRLPQSDVEMELRRSKEVIEGQTWARADFFAYPNDACNRSICSLTKAVGYQAACNGEGKVLTAVGPYALQRIGVHEGLAACDGPNHRGAGLAFVLAKRAFCKAIW